LDTETITNIIENFNTMIDVFKLGYSVYRLNLVFQYASPEKKWK
jgi:hypothetical protein